MIFDQVLWRAFDGRDCGVGAGPLELFHKVGEVVSELVLAQLQIARTAHRPRVATALFAAPGWRTERASGNKKTLREPDRARLPLLRFRPGGVGRDAASRRAITILTALGHYANRQ